jgi:hypothetical protein
MASDISISGNKMLKTVQSEFTKKFPYLSLAIFPSSEKAKSLKTPYGGDTRIADIRGRNTAGDLTITGNKFVKSLEKDFDNIFGLYAEVCYTEKDDKSYYTGGDYDGMSLSTLNKEGEKKGWKKDVKMLKIVAKTTDKEAPAGIKQEAEAKAAADAKAKKEAESKKPKVEKTPEKESEIKSEKRKNATMHWDFDETKKTLTISGNCPMPDYSNTDENRPPWYSQKGLIRNIIIEEGITSIGNYAFYDLKRITELTTPDSVKIIGGYAFAACDYLDKFTSNAKTIGECAFLNCISLNIVKFEGVVEVGNSAFHGCTRLSSVYFGENLERIGNDIFLNCSYLKIYINCEFPPQIDGRLEKGAHYISDLGNRYLSHYHKIYVPKGAENRYKVAAKWKEFEIHNL